MAEKNKDQQTDRKDRRSATDVRPDQQTDRKDRRSATDVRQRDMNSDIQGRNSLQGNDQEAVRNQRRAQPKVGGASGQPQPKRNKGKA